MTLFGTELRENIFNGPDFTAVHDRSRPTFFFVICINLPEKRVLTVNLNVAFLEVKWLPHSAMRYCGQSPWRRWVQARQTFRYIMFVLLIWPGSARRSGVSYCNAGSELWLMKSRVVQYVVSHLIEIWIFKFSFIINVRNKSAFSTSRSLEKMMIGMHICPQVIHNEIKFSVETLVLIKEHVGPRPRRPRRESSIELSTTAKYCSDKFTRYTRHHPQWMRGKKYKV